MASTPALADLHGVPETLVIPLYMRAAETGRPDAIIRDPEAVQIVAASAYDFSDVRRAWMTQVDVAVRTEILDNAVAEFLSRSESSIVINLGAGLDNRFSRVDDGRVRWFDVDLPEVIGIRRRFFSDSDRRLCIPRSLLDFAWIDDIHRQPIESVLVVAEGVLHYFLEADVRRLFHAIADRLPGAEMLFHSTSPSCVSYQPRTRLFRGFSAPFAWGVATGRDVVAWDARHEFIAEWPLIERHGWRWRWLRLAAALPVMGRELRSVMKITHIRFRDYR
ncbi:MAG: class I SAM-dependent methyltransferase [Planctomycetia bacterium]